jgi:hypothetical protein
MIEAALAAAREALAQAPADLVVGSSFGGAVAVRLLRDGDHRGPVVLIAPAAARITGDDALLGEQPHAG